MSDGAKTTPKKRGRPPGPCSKREVAQRKEAASRSAAARSPEGKRACSKNNWRHGRYAKSMMQLGGGKPCQSTCPKYPCVFVTEGKTKPGQRCLDVIDVRDMEHLASSILAAIESKDQSRLNDIASLEMAANVEILHRLRAEIADKGVIIERALFNKDGKQIGTDPIPNPAVALLIKLCSEIGINLPEFMATPAVKERLQSEKEERETAADITRRLMARIGPAMPAGKTIDAEIVESKGGAAP